ncbi:MAG TPA: RHS repeat-associated core domain-containing protein, partial [Streptosporangiaceae bacterium]|nr:RHS repeat-associated core domain-containing protein [Streptosporangiaceae bacterium]
VASHAGTASTALQFDGQYSDAESGFLYLQARYYDPATGQFLSVDPALALTGTPYQYAGNDPVDLSDPSGQLLLEAGLGAIIGAVTGGVVGVGAYGWSVWTGQKKFTVGGLVAGAAGGAVGGAVGGACLGLTDLTAAAICGAAGGAAGDAATQFVSDLFDTTSGFNWTEFGVSTVAGGVLGPIAGKIASDLSPTAGRLPYLLKNVLSPGPNAVRIYIQDMISSALTDGAMSSILAC